MSSLTALPPLLTLFIVLLGCSLMINLLNTWPSLLAQEPWLMLIDIFFDAD